jgi:CheY-like chemotaxis protein
VRLLLVSDNPRVSVQVEAALAGGESVAVVHVATPQRALHLVEEGERFDIVVADGDLTPAGGFVVARELKALGKLDRRRGGRDVPPVVLLLARPQDAWLADWSEADAWITKPVDPFDLAGVVEAIVTDRPVPALPGVGRGGGPMRAEAKAIEGAGAATPPGSLSSGGA